MKKESDFFDRPKVRKTLAVIFAVAFIVLLVSDFFVHKHAYFYYDGFPMFTAVFGLIGSLALVLIAKYMRPFLEREEKYYD
jgi:peptidoglycan/LPS O-acetylase OafA/YrhL